MEIAETAAFFHQSPELAELSASAIVMLGGRVLKDLLSRCTVSELRAHLEPAAGGGLVIKWSSVAGKTYSVHRTTDLSEGFIPLATNLSATAPQNQYTDVIATGAGPISTTSR